MGNPFNPPSFAQRHRAFLGWIIGLALALLVPIPGWIVASFLWPEGVHSDASDAGKVAMFVIAYVGSWIAWGFIVYGVLGMRAGRR
jgi:hypothetical protein